MASIRTGVALWELRVALGALVGGTLAIAGGSDQAVFRNPLADPYLLGAAAGAGLGATAAIVYAGSIPLPPAAFAGATAAVAGAYALGRSVGGRETATPILAGVAMAAFPTALQTLLLQSDADNVRALSTWLLGRLSSAGWTDVLLDEPTSALDVGHQQEALELVDELRAECPLTVLGAMYDLTLAGRYAERLALIGGGRLVAHGPPGEVLTEERIVRRYRPRVRVTRFGDSPVVVPAR